MKKSIFLIGMLGIASAACPFTKNFAQEPTSPTFSLPKGSETLAVIGVRQDEIQLDAPVRNRLQQPCVGFSLNLWIAQALSDTDRFTLIQTGLHTQLINDSVKTHWIDRGQEYETEKLRDLASKIGATFLAYGSISYRSLTEKLGFGPLVRLRRTLNATATVCLYEASKQGSHCSEGSATATWSGDIIILQPADDNTPCIKDVDTATHDAISQAVKNLVSGVYVF